MYNRQCQTVPRLVSSTQPCAKQGAGKIRASSVPRHKPSAKTTMLGMTSRVICMEKEQMHPLSSRAQLLVRRGFIKACRPAANISVAASMTVQKHGDHRVPWLAPYVFDHDDPYRAQDPTIHIQTKSSRRAEDVSEGTARLECNSVNKKGLCRANCSHTPCSLQI